MIRFLWFLVKAALLLVALVLVAGLAFYLALEYRTSARLVEVPEVVGLDPAEATRRLVAVGLHIQFEDDERSAFDDRVPYGAVLRQEPEPGRKVKEGRMVRVTRSLGPRNLFVPRVVGQPLNQAQARIQEAGLRLGAVIYVPSALAGEGLVLDQEPARLPDTDTPVSLLVSGGPPPPSYVMPDLIGRPLQRVRSLLELNRFRVRVEVEDYEGVPEGTIVRHRPLAGYPVAAGDTVWLWASRPGSR